ncbi:GNAT family N-acetyltransferase [Salegentibacter sp. Hel_I_6]|uniref:GNAT family N-acetyltransferase n=1 Tax=Salegentibacter sp. Hel_I_6 TaxID=1250278 RepID=UPI00068E9EA8|nr:GNAT family N-acetyltransferase [Salegentibacter sp. Hel_I_6]
MLDFREIDYQKDISEVVKLIKRGLDKGYTEEFFRWKHLKNPFGKSYGLMAIDNGKIIGLRMFMFWKFSNVNVNKNLIAIRPVDTVVDEDYRGKGLFKELTLRGLEECKGKYDLVFNTPNENSLPGYLKMGWEKVPENSFKLGLFNCFFYGGKTLELTQLPVSLISKSEGWQTFKSGSFLKWRYEDPKYKSASLKTAIVIYSINDLGFFKQIVVQELFGEVNDIRDIIKAVCKKHVTVFVYYYSNLQTKGLKPFYKQARKEAIVVARGDVNKVASNINFSLGDLEGKL